METGAEANGEYKQSKNVILNGNSEIPKQKENGDFKEVLNSLNHEQEEINQELDTGYRILNEIIKQNRYVYQLIQL